MTKQPWRCRGVSVCFWIRLDGRSRWATWVTHCLNVLLSASILNCDLDLGAFSGNVSRCWNELEKKSGKEIWQHLWKLSSELQVLRFRAEEFVYEDLASAHCWRTFVHFQLGEPDWGPDVPDHVHCFHCFVKRVYVSLESEMHLRTHHKNMPVQRPPCMICCDPGQNGVPLMKMTLWAFFRSLMHCWKRYPLLSCIRFRLQIPHKALDPITVRC